MRFIISLIFVILVSCLAKGQDLDLGWYSESMNNGIRIQNSFPKGGHYFRSTDGTFKHSMLVFVTRLVNETDDTVELSLHFSAKPIAIPNTSDTYLKLHLPQDSMTLEKIQLLNYGLGDWDNFGQSSKFERIIEPGQDCLFYVVVVFYQTMNDEWRRERGGNRAELILQDGILSYRMLPQIESLQCGSITPKK